MRCLTITNRTGVFNYNRTGGPHPTKKTRMESPSTGSQQKVEIEPRENESQGQDGQP